MKAKAKGPRKGVYCPVCKVWLKESDPQGLHSDHWLALEITVDLRDD